MKSFYPVLRRFIGRTLITQSLLSVSVVAAVTLSAPIKDADGVMRLTVTGSSATPVTLQAASNLRTWTSLKTFDMAAGSQSYRDTSGGKHQFYRLISGTAPAPRVLPDLAALPNAVFPASEGFDTIQFAPSGKLGFIFWKSGELFIRERDSAQNWVEQKITGGGSLLPPATRPDYKFQPPSILLYDSSSNPHVFKANGNTTISHFTRSGAAWAQSELITAHLANSAIGTLLGGLGPNGQFHLAAVASGDNPNLTHGVKVNGQWTWTKVSDVSATPRYYLSPSYANRWASMAIDKSNAAHFVYRSAFNISFHSQGYVRAYNELHYASNASGQWRHEKVLVPSDISGEAGNGQSIAIASDGKPCIASWYLERADTGSAQWSRLLFHQKDASGKWINSIVATRPDSTYQAGDGEKGTGFAPYLRFDSKGRAHILFSDHASEHFWSGQAEYAGQIRHAWWNGSAWQTETLLNQTTPTQHQMVYPAFAMSAGELAVIGLHRQTAWDLSLSIPNATSTYRFNFLSKPLQ